MNVIFIVSLEQTAAFGELLGSCCRPGDVLCLKGNLGAGKTTLTQSIARGAGIPEKEYVSSPTFSILHHYSGSIELYHMDFYRLSGGEEVVTMGLDEYFYLDGLTVVEWYEQAVEIIPESHLLVELEIIAPERRKIRIIDNSGEWQERMELLVEKLKLLGVL